MPSKTGAEPLQKAISHTSARETHELRQVVAAIEPVKLRLVAGATLAISITSSAKIFAVMLRRCISISQGRMWKATNIIDSGHPLGDAADACVTFHNAACDRIVGV